MAVGFFSSKHSGRTFYCPTGSLLRTYMMSVMNVQKRRFREEGTVKKGWNFFLQLFVREEKEAEAEAIRSRRSRIARPPPLLIIITRTYIFQVYLAGRKIH